MTVRQAIIAAACVLVLAGSAYAEDAKPIATIDTKSIKASVAIDAALKIYPDLYDDLLAEGRGELSTQSAEADKDRKELADIFGDRRYAFERRYSVRSVVGRYVSVLCSDYMDSLAAHPNYHTDIILWDRMAKRRLSIGPFFKETADNGPAMQTLAKAIRAALVENKKARDIPDVDNDTGIGNVKPEISSIGAIALAPSTEKGKSSGLITYFSPYEVGSYVEGSYILFVPWTVFKDHLSAAGATLFGGERPEDDAKKDEP